MIIVKNDFKKFTSLEAYQKPIFLSFSMQNRSHFMIEVFMLPERWKKIVEIDDNYIINLKNFTCQITA